MDSLENPWTNPYGKLVVLIFVLNVVSAALFMLQVNRPVYDDPYNIFDVHTYATRGVSIATIRANRNPPGPTSFLWMAASVRLLGGDELLDARFAVLSSWALLVAGVLVGTRIGRFPQAWLGALLASLVFPHSVEATGLVLTEGPALLFATLGALVWIEFASRSEISPVMLAAGIAGGLSMGISATCRGALEPRHGFRLVVFGCLQGCDRSEFFSQTDNRGLLDRLLSRSLNLPSDVAGKNLIPCASSHGGTARRYCGWLLQFADNAAGPFTHARPGHRTNTKCRSFCFRPHRGCHNLQRCRGRFVVVGGKVCFGLESSLGLCNPHRDLLCRRTVRSGRQPLVLRQVCPSDGTLLGNYSVLAPAPDHASSHVSAVSLVRGQPRDAVALCLQHVGALTSGQY